MVDHVVLKRLTLASDLGWFHSIHDNRKLKGHQKGITLNKSIINKIWPELVLRQANYDAAKYAEVAARNLGDAGIAAAAMERNKAQDAGHLPVKVEIFGPAGKPPLFESRLMALQDKNWRLNGAFIEDPLEDPIRFNPVLQEGDLALIGFDGIELPTRAVVVLLAQSTHDAPLMANLAPLVTKGAKSMVQLTPDFLQKFADEQGLPLGHIIRTLAGDPVVEAALEEIVQGDLAAATKIRVRRPSRAETAEELAAGIAASTLTGQRGERMVNALLADQHKGGGPVHRWKWPMSAAHPYDFELLSPTGSVDIVIDAKSTSAVWTADFYMSSAELAHAVESPVPYLIYRLSKVGPTGAWLRMSDDIRNFATVVAPAFADAAPVGTRVTTIAISPIASGLTWSDPVRLPPAPP
jgi:hypothetical protein